MRPQKQAINPLLLRETAIHQPASSVQAVLNVLQRAELGDITAQAELFADMEERDAHIYAEITKRKMAISQLDWSLRAPRDAGAREKKDIAALQLLIEDMIDIDTLVFDMADAIGHGFSAHEIEWKPGVNGWYLPVALYPRPQRWFTVDKDTYREIRLRSNTGLDGDALARFGWLLHQHSSKTGYPATQGLYRALALPYLFKNFAIKNWLRFCELYAVPIRVLFHHEQDETRKLQLMDSLQNLGSSGVALFQGGLPDDFRTVDATTGEGQGFQALIDWCEKSVSKAILGGTLSSQADGKTSTNALGKIHDEVRYQIREHDARQIAATLTSQLLGAIIALNGLTIRPRWVFDTQEPEDLALYAEALPKLVAVGAQIPLGYVHEKLKIPLPEEGEAVLFAQQTAQNDAVKSNNAGLMGGFVKLSGDKSVFTPEQQVIEDMADDLLEQLPSPISSAALASVIKAAKDPDDLEKRLAVLMAGADLSEFTRVLERALFTADVLGYAHAS